MFRLPQEFLFLKPFAKGELISNDKCVINNNMKENLIAIKTFNFAIKIINLNKVLITKKEYVFSKQILKSGISIGANVEEAIEQKCLFLTKKLEKLITGYDY
jgi:23S rRNA-intervening sequence protein